MNASGCPICYHARGPHRNAGFTLIHMCKRILILDSGPNAVKVVMKARQLGFHTVALAGDPASPVLNAAHEGTVTSYRAPGELLRVARESGVDGIYPAPEPAALPVAHVTAQLGLAGPGPDAVSLLHNKLAMREVLEARGVPNPPFHGARTAKRAEAAARRIGLPLIVKPADSFASKGVRQVDHAEDLSLAFSQARSHSPTDTVLLEALMQGDEFCIEGVMRDGDFTVLGIMGKQPSDSPFCFARGVFMPAPLDDAARESILGILTAAFDALGLACGCLHAEVMLTPEGPRIIEIAPYPASAATPADLTRLAYGVDTTEVCLRMAAGEVPRCTHGSERGAAVLWIPARSGVVEEIRGVEKARAIPGIQDVVVAAKPGDIIRHAEDCATRDRIGYVVATGDTVAAALDAAERARDLCRIVTSYTLN